MFDFLTDLKPEEYVPGAIAWGTNILLAIVILLIGLWFAGRVALLGAAGLAVGLALQGAMSNLAAGVMLLIFRPYKVGDFIDAAGQFGNVTEIDMFTTVMQTFDNKQIIIPNSQIWGEQIVNHSHYDVRGVDMHFGVAYDENIDAARKVIDSVLSNHSMIVRLIFLFGHSVMANTILIFCILCLNRSKKHLMMQILKYRSRIEK